MSNSLELDDVLGTVTQTTASWRRFGLLENPFPSRSHPIWDVFHNQAQVRQRFYKDLREFIQAGKTTTLFFTGGNRIGKTHFCEHHRMKLPGEFAKRKLIVPIAMVSAESCRFFELYRPIIDQLDDSLRIQTGHGLFPESWRPQLATIADTLAPGDFRQAVRTIARADNQFASTHALLMQWLKGERIRLSQRRELDVGSVIDSLGHALNVLQGLTAVLRGLTFGGGERCPGVMLFVDEFELIWTRRRDQRDRFLQALRALVDACPMGLFLCVAMATGIGAEVEDVENEYPALFARLKGSQDIPALVEVAGVVEAQEYAKAFMDYAYQKAEYAHVPSADIALFGPAEIREFYIEIAAAGSTVSQGDFFDKLHVEAENRAMNP
jgi:hypothetical protein